MRTTTKFWLTSSSTNPHSHLLLTHHFLGVHTIGSAWLMFISRIDMFCFWTCPMCVHCSFQPHILESHLAMIQTPQYITFLSKNLNTHRTWCIIMSGKKSHEIQKHIQMCDCQEHWTVILNGDSRCQQMHAPSLILIRCHNQLLFKQQEPKL